MRLSAALIQPIASDDVAEAVADHALADPVNGMVDIAGPERFRMDELVQRYLVATADPRKVVTDPQARYFGAELKEGTLVPEGAAWLGKTTFDAWMAQSRGAPR
ncbi:hypothetical protein D3C72_1555740 [compost metagenome]